MLVSMVLLKCTNAPLVIHFLNFVRFFHLQVLLTIIVSVSFLIFFYLSFLLITLANTLFLLLLKLRTHIPLTTIPLQQTIDLAINLIFSHNRNLNISKKELIKIFLFATSQTHFIFNSKFYNQIEEVPMSCPLVLALGNIFMGFYESKWLNEYNLNKPKFYLRYVDDILAAFDNEQDSLNFLNFLNNRHPNIKFTIEKQINHSIAFLDVFISGINNQILTLQTYHKSTYTGLLLNLKSFTSFSYKISLIKCLIDRLLKICNNWTCFLMTQKTLNPILLKMHIHHF